MAKSASGNKTSDAPAGGGGPPQYSDQDKAKARAWFKKADDERGRRAYDYAIECYVSGLGFWPEAVEEGHMPLWSLAIQRQQAGGKKPGMMDSIKRPISGKNVLTSMLNAELLLAKDPTSATYLDGVLKNAVKAELRETVKFIAPKVLDSLRREKKQNLSRFRTFRQLLVEMAEKADRWGDAPTAAWCYEAAVNAVELLIVQNPGDMALRDEQRDLSGRLTITKGKYAEADSFRDSLRDGASQKLLHDAERAKQGESTLETLIVAARKDYEANPTVPQKIKAYVEALSKREDDESDDRAVAVLMNAYRELDNYSFKVSADDILLRKLGRRTRALRDKAARTAADEDRQQLRLARAEELQTELEIRRERVKMYPTDLRAKYRCGAVLFQLGEYDEAIPMLQAAQGDPRSRTRCQLMIGRAFLLKQAPAQAAAVLRDALDSHDVAGDDVAKELMWWLGQALEASSATDDARATYGKLLRLDYNYANGEARKRLEALS